jgi:hypothetical protein
MRLTINTCFLAALLLIISPIQSEAKNQTKAEVLMFGVFHFANPGKDKVKAKKINVMTDANQSYLDSLAEKISHFNPTHVLIECDLSKTVEYQQRYLSFINGEYELPSNENYQLGFRIAKASKLVTPESLSCYNENSIGWNADLLFDFMPKHDPAAKAALDKTIADLTEQTTKDHQTKSLAELLLKANDPNSDKINKGLYIITNGVGAGENFAGADAAASWWHRNFRMYANIQKVAQANTRVLVIGGQGHTAILKDMLADDPDRNAKDIRAYLN